MEENQQVEIEEDRFMEERKSSLIRKLDSVGVEYTVSEIKRETEYEDPEALIVVRELEELDMAQQRKHNFQNLDSALKQHILSLAKAKEEVKVWTLHNDIDEIRETRKHTENVVSKKKEEVVKILESLQEDYNNCFKMLESLTLLNTQRLMDDLNAIEERLMQVEQECEIIIKACYNERYTYEWNFEEMKENVTRSQRELSKYSENVKTLKLRLEKCEQEMQQLKKSIEGKNGECNSLKKKIDESKLAELIKKPLQNLNRGIKRKAKGKPLSSQQSILMITLDTTEDESENDRHDFSELRIQLSNIKRPKT